MHTALSVTYQLGTHYPCSRAVFTAARKHGPSTRVVFTELKAVGKEGLLFMRSYTFCRSQHGNKRLQLKGRSSLQVARPSAHSQGDVALAVILQYRRTNSVHYEFHRFTFTVAIRVKLGDSQVDSRVGLVGLELMLGLGL